MLRTWPTAEVDRSESLMGFAMSPRLAPRYARHLIAAGGLVLTLATTASADTYPPCDHEPSPADIEGAKGAHKAAEAHYNKGRYDRAIAAWLDAYNFDCTAHRLLLNIGNAYEKLGDRPKAIEAFEIYLERAGDAADPTIADKVANLKALESAAQSGPTPTATATATTTATGPQPPPPPPPNGDDGPGAGPWILVGAGGAVTIAGVILAIVGAGKISESEERCPGRECPAGDEDYIDVGNDGRVIQGVGIAAAVVGALAVGGGLTWYFLADSGDGSAAPQGRLQVTPWLSPWTAGASLTASF